MADITTRSRIRDSKAALAHECLYVNFLFEMEPKKLIIALEEKGWIIAMQEELNQFERNKIWTLVSKPHGEPMADITTRSRIRDSKAALAHECLYVNFLFEMEPKKLIIALEEKGWIIAMQEELNQFERNKIWTLVSKPHGKTINETKWFKKNKMYENRVIIKNKARMVAQGY
nr:retrovirus-related Pol polyprotein from transposon TNT 1-94 [Tanacetum cinerariifolium]